MHGIIDAHALAHAPDHLLHAAGVAVGRLADALARLADHFLRLADALLECLAAVILDRLSLAHQVVEELRGLLARLVDPVSYTHLTLPTSDLV